MRTTLGPVYSITILPIEIKGESCAIKFSMYMLPPPATGKLYVLVTLRICQSDELYISYLSTSVLEVPLTGSWFVIFLG